MTRGSGGKAMYYKRRGDSTTPHPTPKGRRMGPALYRSRDGDKWRSGSQERKESGIQK
jgi:hypothetical protein